MGGICRKLRASAGLGEFMVTAFIIQDSRDGWTVQQTLDTIWVSYHAGKELQTTSKSILRGWCGIENLGVLSGEYSKSWVVVNCADQASKCYKFASKPTRLLKWLCILLDNGSDRALVDVIVHWFDPQHHQCVVIGQGGPDALVNIKEGGQTFLSPLLPSSSI